MKFGLWMAYTQGSSSEDPRSLSVSKHPDWFITKPKLDPDGHINWDALIDLGYDPGARLGETIYPARRLRIQHRLLQD